MILKRFTLVGSTQAFNNLMKTLYSMLRPVVITGISLMCGCADSCSKQEPSNNASDGEQGSQGGEQGSQGGEQGSQGGAGAGSADPVVTQRLEAYRAKTGPITVTLIWDTKDDLDLSVVTPSKEVINWEEKISTCGGVLQIDATIIFILVFLAVATANNAI